jgi:CPA2 family monovalent cation:H+ antiporter-2
MMAARRPNGVAGAIDPLVFKDGLIVLGTAGVVVPLMHRFKVSPVLGFIAAGFLVGPSGLGAWAPDLPGLKYVTVTDRSLISLLAELGVVFLLFVIGLELSLERLRTMRKLVLGLGGLQVLITGFVLGGIGMAFGLSAEAALVVGLALALSSTAVAVELLAREKRLSSHVGRAALAVLILQDLAFIPILFVIQTHATASGLGLWAELALALGKAALAIGIVVLVGRFVLPRLLAMAARTDSAELFLAATLLVVVATGIGTVAAGLSMALGAFVAGLMLAETEYRRAIEATIEPFKGLLLGVFFLSVGMLIDLDLVFANPLLLVGAAIALIVLKAAIAIPLIRLFGLPKTTAIPTGLLLASSGEFAFVLFAAAVAAGLLAPTLAGQLLIIVVLTMLAMPLLDWLGRQWGEHHETRAANRTMIAQPFPEEAPHQAVVIGYGRVGQLVCSLLEEHKVSYVAIDKDTALVADARRRGKPVFFGDIANPVFLSHSGVRDARAVILTTQQFEAIADITRAILGFRADAVIVARARDADHAQQLYRLGVTDAVPETVEASLQLSEAALSGLGVPAGPVIASIHERRDRYRQALMDAARKPSLGFGRLRRAKVLDTTPETDPVEPEQQS